MLFLQSLNKYNMNLEKLQYIVLRKMKKKQYFSKSNSMERKKEIFPKDVDKCERVC